LLIDCEEKANLLIDFEHSPLRRCYSAKLLEILKKSGPQKAIYVLDQYRQTPKGAQLISESRCHSLGHDLGNMAVKLSYSSDEIIKGCQNNCGGGCINGAAHYYTLQGRTIGELESFCSSANVSQELVESCYHGIGHALIETTGLDLNKSFPICASLHDEVARYQCGHALVMDSALASTAPVVHLPDKIASFCTEQLPIFQPSCFTYSGFLTYAKTLSAISAFEQCQKVPEKFKDDCQFRLGEILFFRFKASDLKGSAQECLLASTVDESISCAQGVHFISLGSPRGEADDFPGYFCSLVSKKDQALCFLKITDSPWEKE
jgi:hypothetical protein